jgi:hypothetical protein
MLPVVRNKRQLLPLQTMKKQVAILLLVSLLVGCGKKSIELKEPETKPQKPNYAALMAGKYTIKKAVSYGSDITSNYSATLTVIPIDSFTVKADYVIPSTDPFSETWTLRPLANDVIAIRGGYAQQYENGQIKAMLADGILYLTFAKKGL